LRFLAESAGFALVALIPLLVASYGDVRVECSEESALSRALHKSRELLLGVLRPDQRFCYTNEAFREAFLSNGSDPEVENLPFAEPTWDEFQFALSRAREGAVKTIEVIHGEREDSKYFELTVEPIEDDPGHVLVSGYNVAAKKETELQIERNMVALQDRTVDLEAHQQEIRRLNDELVQLARSDALTGLRNFRSFHEEFERVVACAEPGTKVSLLIADVDLFKRINDRFGHLKGDEVLQRVAGLIQSSIQEEATIARYGGEEFLVLLTGVGMDMAQRVAERCRAEIENFRWHDTPVTVSIGVCTREIDGNRNLLATEMVGAADEALYCAKAAGRNRVRTCRR
jgi:diguanylate cyclase (GGDEF)-like protein